MALILSIETGTDICSVALSRDNTLLALRESVTGREHAAKLGVYIDEILRENEVEPDELDAVAVGKGPGSYTGLRIGVSMAKGLCYGLEIPLIGIGSLEALACVAAEDFEAGILDIDNWETAHLCPMIDARRMEVYAQVFDTNFRVLTSVGAHVIEPDSFADSMGGGEFVIFGNGAQKCVTTLESAQVKFVEVTPSARGVAALAYDAFKAEKFEDMAYFEPFYLKDFVVLTSTKKKLF